MKNGLRAFDSGGVLEKFPNLRVAFLEDNCAWLPWLLYRRDERAKLQGPLADVPLMVTACFNLLMSELPQQFPKLRWGFIEASQWVPWIYREVAIRYAVSGRTFPKNIFEEYKVYVTCQTNNDVPYIVKYAGELRLVIGTDYGHTDPSSAVSALAEFQRMEGIDQAVKERILTHNPKELYAL
jgi:predicted TIM-barrel fold metal-dependent hydrolase